jgi:hypothetical protein
MSNRNTLTKVLASLGTLFVWVPVLAPIFFSLMRLLQAGRFQFDYLLPAELFPLAWLGGGLLIWAAIRARLRIRPIAISAALMVLLWLAASGVAIATGLASGRTEPVGPVMILVVVPLVLYSLAVLATAILGILLLRDLFQPAPSVPENN